MPQSETTQLVKKSLAFICRRADTRSLTPVSLRRLDLCDQYGVGCHPDADIEPLILLMSMFDRSIPVRFVSPLISLNNEKRQIMQTETHNTTYSVRQFMEKITSNVFL